MARGKLRLYLGAAPGVGKTYAMLNEGWRRKERGTDVVIGWVAGARPAPDRRPDPRPAESSPAGPVEYRGQTFEEMDLEGLLARQPELVLVDELAHTNIPGSEHAKRWQDVDDLLDAGINVISTVNLQHLESLNDVVERITGVAQQETVPDRVVRAADQIELVDMAPEALRRRLAHGNVYPPERIDAALGNYFRTGQPHRPARAGPAVGGRPGRRGAPRLPRAPRHRRAVGDQGAGRGVPHRLAGQRRADPAGRPDGHADQGRAGRACTCAPTTGSPDAGIAGARAATGRCSTTWAAATWRWWGPTWPRPWSRWPGPRTPPSW